MSYIEIVNLFLSIILIFFHFSFFYSLIKYKKIRTKEDNLFLYKALSTVICFSCYIILFIALVLSFIENDRDGILYKIQEYIFNGYILVIYTTNFFSSIEMYYTYKTPIHYFSIIFRKKSRKIYDLIILILIAGFTVLDILDPLNFNDSLKIKNKNTKTYGSPFIIIDNFKWLLFALMSFFTIFLNFKLLNLIKNFCFEKKEKLLKIIKKKIIINYFYLCYTFFSIFVSGALTIKPKLNVKSTIFMIDSFLIFLILIIDTIIELSIISTSKFSQYKLSSNIIGIFGYVFPNDFIEDESYNIGEITMGSSNTAQEETEDLSLNNSSIEKTLLPKCIQDEDIISIFRNNVYIEDYFISFLDQYLNILTASLSKIYNSKLFSIKKAENKKLQKDLGNIDVSNIGGITTNNISTTNDLSTITLETADHSNFSFSRNKNKDNFAFFRDILGNNTDEINVNILSYLTDDCVFNIDRFNLIPKRIASSLISHFILKGKKTDKNEDKNYFSLTASNLKEEYFTNLKKISFKSNDRYFNFDFFETKEGNLSNFKVDILNNYFYYLQNGKGKMGSFLPEVIGIFKIKINDFNPVLIYVSKNALVDNIPKNYFTFWQLLSFGMNKPMKISSSKFNRGTLVKDDNIFEKFLIEENKNDIYLKNFSEFKEILENDFNFLRENKILNVNFLMMYLEYENTKKHESQGAVQIKKSLNNTAEIVEVNINIKEPNDNIFNNKDLNNNDNNIISDDKLDLNNEEMPDDFFIDEGFDSMPDLGAGAHSLIDYTEKVNISGYEGNYDDFICLCFFTFENVFDLDNIFGIKPDEKFKNKILNKFKQYQKGENE